MVHLFSRDRMPSDSSAVHHLIQQVHSRRLRTDPADASLFQSAPAVRAPRMWHSATLPVAAAEVVAAARTSRPAAPSRDRTWPWIVGTLLAGVVGVVIAARPWVSNDAPPASAPIVAPVVAPVAAPAAAETPAPVAAPIEAAAPVAAVTPAPAAEPAPAEPTVAAAAPAEPPAAPTLAAAAPAQPTAAHHRRTHVKAKHALKHAKGAHKHAIAAEPAPAAEVAPAEQPAAAPAAPPAKAHHAAQSDDGESPL